MPPAHSPLTLLKIALLLPAYAVVALLAAISKRPRSALALAATGFIFAASQTSGCTPRVRVGTFNIRQFGGGARDTDMAKLVASVDADILAVQEIQSEAKPGELAAALSRGRSRTYRVGLSTCGGRSEMRGFVYDERRITLASTKEYLGPS